MNGDTRRKELLKILYSLNEPISGTKLAEKFNVSRQVIVQDIALLRANKIEIMATARGYMIYLKDNETKKRVIAIKHEDEQIRQELEIIVDNGGKVIDVIIEHEVYGQIKADLMINTRKDINQFINKIKKSTSIPLKALTKGKHYHTIEAKSESDIDEIVKLLKSKIENKMT